MVRFPLVSALVVATGCATMGAAQVPDFVTTIERASPAVVAIVGGSQTLGSGFVVAANRVVTAAHVTRAARGPLSIIVAAKKIDARLLRSDERTDLALLEVTGGTLPAPLSLSQTPPRVGEWVVVLGNPFGGGITATAGIVSAMPGAITATPELAGRLQINAAVNPGNSGGPILNLRGDVIAVASALLPGGQGLAFATPASAARDLLAAAP